MQHSGSVRYYSGRPTLRYDALDADWLDRAIAHVRTAGFEPYLILERWELAKFRERFPTQRTLAFIERPPLAVHSREVYVFGTGTSAGAQTPQPIPHTTGCE
jgi:hypothetical protein